MQSNNLLFVLLQYSNQDLGFDEPSYWTLLIMIIIGVIYYFIVYLPKQKVEEKENQRKLQERKQSEAYYLSQISLGNQILFFAPHNGHYKCPVCSAVDSKNWSNPNCLDNRGKCPICGFRIDMIPKNTDGTYTIRIYNKGDKRDLEKMAVKDFSFILLEKTIENVEERE